MSDFYKDFLRESGRLPNQPPGPRVILGALGKHPGWDDHIDGLLDTETLALFKNVFYVQGIGRAIDSGAWDKSEVASDLIGFDHYLMWIRGDQFLLGRLWASSDGRGRTKYPMILCAQCSGLPLDWALRNILPELDKMREACRNVRTAGEVRQIIQKAQANLQDKAAAAPIRAGAIPSLDRAAFLAGPELGPEHVGLMRILHELESNFIAYRKAKLGKAVGADVRAQHIRVPRNAASPAESLLAWREFFNLLFPRDLALLFVAPEGKSWLDIFAGEPSANEIVPLRVQSVGLASSVPYQIGPEIAVACVELARQFETGQPLPSGTTRIFKSTENKQISATETWAPAPPAKGLNLKLLGAIGGGLLLILLVCLLWPRHSKEGIITPLPLTNHVVQSPPPRPVSPANDRPIVAEPSWSPPTLEREGAERQVIRTGSKIAPISFQASDKKTPFDRLTWSFVSSNPALLPVDGIRVVHQEAALWQVTAAVAPGKTGTASITVILKNEGGLASTNAFQIIVQTAARPRFDQVLGDIRIVHGRTVRGIVKVSERENPAARLQLKARVEPFPWVTVNVAGAGAEWTVDLAAIDAAPGRGKLVLELSDGETRTTNESMIEVIPPEAPVFITAPHGVTEIPAGKMSPPIEFVISNKSGAPDQIRFSVSSVVQRAISDDHLRITHDGAAWHLKITPNDGATGQIGLEAVATDGFGSSATYRFMVVITAPAVAAPPAAAPPATTPTATTPTATTPTATTSTATASTATASTATASAATASAATAPAAAVPAGPPRNSLGMEFVWVANLPGTEKAGWDAAHQQGGWVAKYLVTQKDFLAVMHTNPSIYKDGGPLCPVENMTLEDVDDFCHKLAALDQNGRLLPTGWSYQLLTVDQWKFCADATRDADCVLSYPTSKRSNPAPVGSLGANSLGLFDTIGNVYEVTLRSNNAKALVGAYFSQIKTAVQARKTLFTFSGPNQFTGFRIAVTPAVQTP